MGDTRINLNSPEQMSWVIYSRKPKDKLEWANTFTPYMDVTEYKKNVKDKSDIVYKTEAQQCADCQGTGYYRKVKKDGTPYTLDLPNVITVILLATYLFLVNW
jgi:hypothetical protein